MDLSKMKNGFIKAELRAYGLSTKGRRPVIIKRLKKALETSKEKDLSTLDSSEESSSSSETTLESPVPADTSVTEVAPAAMSHDAVADPELEAGPVVETPITDTPCKFIKKKIERSTDQPRADFWVELTSRVDENLPDDLMDSVAGTDEQVMQVAQEVVEMADKESLKGSATEQADKEFNNTRGKVTEKVEKNGEKEKKNAEKKSNIFGASTSSVSFAEPKDDQPQKQTDANKDHGKGNERRSVRGTAAEISSVVSAGKPTKRRISNTPAYNEYVANRRAEAERRQAAKIRRISALNKAKSPEPRDFGSEPTTSRGLQVRKGTSARPSHYSQRLPVLHEEPSANLDITPDTPLTVEREITRAKPIGYRRRSNVAEPTPPKSSKTTAVNDEPSGTAISVRPYIPGNHFPTRADLKFVRCKLCSFEGRRTRTSYKCEGCNANLCIVKGCFKRYHKPIGFKNNTRLCKNNV